MGAGAHRWWLWNAAFHKGTCETRADIMKERAIAPAMNPATHARVKSHFFMDLTYLRNNNK